MNSSLPTLQVEEKINHLVDYLIKRRHSDGTIRTEIHMSELAKHFNLGNESIFNLLKSYYTYIKGTMYPRGHGFKPTVVLFLREYRYQNSLTTKRHNERNNIDTSDNFLIVSDIKTGKLLVKEKNKCKANHQILSSCKTVEHATKRWQELMKEKLQLI